MVLRSQRKVCLPHMISFATFLKAFAQQLSSHIISINMSWLMTRIPEMWLALTFSCTNHRFDVFGWNRSQSLIQMLDRVFHSGHFFRVPSLSPSISWIENDDFVLKSGGSWTHANCDVSCVLKVWMQMLFAMSRILYTTNIISNCNRKITCATEFFEMLTNFKS